MLRSQHRRKGHENCTSVLLLLLLLLRSNAGMLMSYLEVDVLDELGSGMKFLLGSRQFVPEVQVQVLNLFQTYSTLTCTEFYSFVLVSVTIAVIKLTRQCEINKNMTKLYFSVWECELNKHWLSMFINK